MATMEGESETVYSSNSLGRRGLQVRQRRQINVHRPGEEGAEGQRALAVPGGPTPDETRASPVPKYAPKLYVPEKQRTEGAVQQYDVRTGSPYGSSPSATSSYGSRYLGSGGVGVDSHTGGSDRSSLYPSRIITGREPLAAAGPAESVLSTSRGLFKLRPKRTVKVLTDDSPSGGSPSAGYVSAPASSHREDSGSSSSSLYGFVREQPGQRDHLARRGRQSLSDMLGSASPAADHISSTAARQPAIYSPAVPALMPPPDVGSEMAVLQPVTDLFSKYGPNMQEEVGHYAPDPLFMDQPLAIEARHPPVGSETGIDLSEPALPIHLNGISKKHSFTFLDDSVESEQAVVPALNGGEAYRAHTGDGGTDGMTSQETNFAITRPHYENPLDTIALLKDRLSESRSSAQEIPQNETLDERKERILGNLYRQKFAVLPEPEKPAASTYETLAEKKEKILANLRRKHNANLQANDLLGINSDAGVRPDFSRSLSLGATLGDNSKELAPANIPLQQKELSIFQPAEPLAPPPEVTSQSVWEQQPKNGENASSRGPGSFQLRSAAQNQPLFSRNQPDFDSNVYANSNSSEGSRSQGHSPNEDMMSVDSGFHDRITSESAVKEEADGNQQSNQNQNSKPSGNTGNKAASPPKSPPYSRKNLKPVNVSDKKNVPKGNAPTSVKTSDFGSLLKKKLGPPTKPKPQAPVQTPTHVKPRPKSAPPSKSKSKSTTNLVDVGLSVPRESRERSSSVAKEAECLDEKPFSRNSRLRSSTKAWEMRQAEQKQSKANSPPKVPPKPAAPVAKKSVVVGKVSLSEERTEASLGRGRSTHTPRTVVSYDKPWRTGSALAKPGSASPATARRSSRPDTRERSNSSCTSSRNSSPVSERTPRNRTTSTSETSSRTQSPSSGANRSRRNSRDNILSSSSGASPTFGASVGKPPKNPVKDQGSVVQGCPRSRSPPKSSPLTSKSPGHHKLKKNTKPSPFNFASSSRRRKRDHSLSSNPDSDTSSDVNDISHEEYHSLLNLAAEWQIETRGVTGGVVTPDSAVSDPSTIADDLEVPLLSLDALGTLDATSEEELLFRQWIEDKDSDSGRDRADSGVEMSGKDETDFAKPVGIPKGSKRFTGATSGTLQPRKSAGAKPTVPTTKRKRPTSTAVPARTGAAGAVDEEFFIRNFEEVPKVHIFSSREFTEKATKIREMLGDTNHDWEKRVDALKEIRSLMVAGAADYDDFTQLLRQLEPSVVLSVKDLRSQVVREACITVSYLSQQLGNKFDHFAEALLPSLFNLIPNSAKVMATSGTVCIRFIIQHTHATRLIPIITNGTAAKSNIIRRECFEFLSHLLHTWPTHPLERHIALLQEAIKKGITDADSEARTHSRKAFWGFADHFRDQADSLLNSLDPSKQKMLQGELSNSSSNNSLSSGGASRLSSSKGKSRSRSMSSERTSQQLYSRTLGGTNAPRRMPASKTSSTSGEEHTDGSTNGRDSSGILRSSSAVDLTGGGGHRGGSSLPRSTSSAGSHNNYSSLRFKNLRQMKAFKRKGSTDGSIEDLEAATAAADRPRTLSASDLSLSQSQSASRSSVDLLTPDKSLRGSTRRTRTSLLPTNTPSSRPKKKSVSSSNTAQSIISPERSRPRSRIGVSQSQPGSRSGSPSSRLSYITHTHTQSTASASSRPRHKTGIPRSQGASRETSPSRHYGKASRSGIPRSQGASRETSPSRHYGKAGRSGIPRSQGASRETSPSRHYGRERRLSGQNSKMHTPAGRVSKNGGGHAGQEGGAILNQPLLPQGYDVEEAVADALEGHDPTFDLDSTQSLGYGSTVTVADQAEPQGLTPNHSLKPITQKPPVNTPGKTVRQNSHTQTPGKNRSQMRYRSLSVDLAQVGALNENPWRGTNSHRPLHDRQAKADRNTAKREGHWREPGIKSGMVITDENNMGQNRLLGRDRENRSVRDRTPNRKPQRNGTPGRRGGATSRDRTPPRDHSRGRIRQRNASNDRSQPRTGSRGGSQDRTTPSPGAQSPWAVSSHRSRSAWLYPQGVEPEPPRATSQARVPSSRSHSVPRTLPSVKSPSDQHSTQQHNHTGTVSTPHGHRNPSTGRQKVDSYVPVSPKTQRKDGPSVPERPGRRRTKSDRTKPKPPKPLPKPQLSAIYKTQNSLERDDLVTSETSAIIRTQNSLDNDDLVTSAIIRTQNSQDKDDLVTSETSAIIRTQNSLDQTDDLEVSDTSSTCEVHKIAIEQRPESAELISTNVNKYEEKNEEPVLSIDNVEQNIKKQSESFFFLDAETLPQISRLDSPSESTLPYQLSPGSDTDTEAEDSASSECEASCESSPDTGSVSESGDQEVTDSCKGTEQMVRLPNPPPAEAKDNQSTTVQTTSASVTLNSPVPAPETSAHRKVQDVRKVSWNLPDTEESSSPEQVLSPIQKAIAEFDKSIEVNFDTPKSGVTLGVSSIRKAIAAYEQKIEPKSPSPSKRASVTHTEQKNNNKLTSFASSSSTPLSGDDQSPQSPSYVEDSPGVSDPLVLTITTRGGPLRKRYESYDSDDAASETSSVCSERSFSSYSKTSECLLSPIRSRNKASDLGERRSSLRMAKLSRSREDVPHSPFSQDMSEIISNLSSGSWADRKEGLIALQNLLRGNRLLNRLELKKITEIFTRMFHDPHGKVFSVFMETLIELVAAHRAELQDWLYVCLTRLLNKMGADLLGSVQVKVQRALEAVRDSFPYDHQFQIVNRFIVDQTQTPNLKVKVALLNYMHGLALLMDPSEFNNTSDTRLAVSRIITWTTEPKSVDVRKAAQAVLIALFNLNSPEFSMMLSVLPKTFQDGATRILHNHLRSASQDQEPLSPRNITSPTYGNRYRPSPSRPAKIEDVDTENMNPEDIYNSIKKTSADIQNLSKMDSQYEDVKKERDNISQDSGIQGSLHDVRGNSPDVKDSHRNRGRQYNPSYYQDDSLNGYNKAALAEAVFDVDNDMLNEAFNEDLAGDQSDIVAEILKELSNHNQRSEERTNAMMNLIKITRDGSSEVWDEHFKTILLLLLETLGDEDGHIRALALRVLREILRHQPGRFKEYAELTILKILEAHKDDAKEVARAAEECATTLAHSIPAEQCIRVLNPIIQTAEYPVNLAAIKMETKVIEKSEAEVICRTLPEVIPGLLMGYDNRESPVRKASVFCLVALYLSVGDELKPHIHDLSGSKMKLLNLYIKRSLAEKGQSGPGLYSTDTSKTTSPASTVTDLGL